MIKEAKAAFDRRISASDPHRRKCKNCTKPSRHLQKTCAGYVLFQVYLKQNSRGVFPARLTLAAPLNDWKQFQLKLQQNGALQVNVPGIVVVVVVVRLHWATVPLPPRSLFHSPEGLSERCLGSPAGQKRREQGKHVDR